MSVPPNSSPTSSDTCLLHVVAAEMASEPTLEAIKVDRAGGALSVATLGDTRQGQVADRVAARLREASQSHPQDTCALLSGATSCNDCPRSAALRESHRFSIQHSPAITTIARVTCPTAPRFWRWWERPLPKFVPREVRLPEDEHAENEWKAQLVAAVLCGLSLVLAWILPAGAAERGMFLFAYLTGAWYPAVEVWERLRERQLDVHFLMLAVAAGAAAIGAWGEGATLLFLFSFSGALEHYAMGRTHREIRSLIRTAPKEATVLDANGQEHLEPVESLVPGLRLLVKPGEAFPVDAEIVRGSTAADESNLTGEAVPVEKVVGDGVLGGTLNLWGAVEVVVTRPPQQSALQRVIQLIHESQQLRAPSQRFTDRFGTGYTLAVLGLTVVAFFTWWLALGKAPFVPAAGERSAFYLAMTLLVVASPCALVLSIPSAILAAIARGARQGILIRGGAAVEKLAEIQVVAMDKTGTLTTGELRVEAIESFPPGREDEVGRLVFGVERLSDHPLARAITRHGKHEGWKAAEVRNLQSVTGQGLRAEADGQPVTLGRREFVLADRAEPPSLPTTLPLPGPGLSEVWLAAPGLLGRVLLRDDVRPEARAVVERLRQERLHTVVLTGDRRATGEHLQHQLELDEVRAELKPEDKVAAVAEFAKAGRHVAMIGDGVNDAPALAAAHVGVAMGARGSDAALEQADVVLMHDRLENFLTAYELSRRARAIIRQNLVISLGTVVLLALLALLGRIPLTLGVVGHEGSTVVVVLNSLRLLLLGRRPRSPAPAPASPRA